MKVCQYSGQHSYAESGYCVYCGIRDDEKSDAVPAVTAVHAVTLYQAVCHSCGWESALIESANTAALAVDAHECAGPRPG